MPTGVRLHWREAGDPARPAVRRVAATIPEARLHVIQGGPHFPNRTHRRKVQSVIDALLRELGI